jgi:hypothetical protein
VVDRLSPLGRRQRTKSTAVAPQIIKTSGLSNIVVSFLAAIPYIFASVGMIWWAWHVDRTGKKIGTTSDRRIARPMSSRTLPF